MLHLTGFLFFFLTISIPGLRHQSSLPAKADDHKTFVLYDASLTTQPEQQGWIYLTSHSGSSAVSRSVSDNILLFDTKADLTEMAGFFGNSHPAIPELDRTEGFSLEFEMQLINEQHTDPNRAGFSIIILSSDHLGVELAFWTDQIWAYSSDFIKSEGVSFNTSNKKTRYTITLKDNQYTLYADGNMLLSGTLRDYSDFGIPYNLPSFIFFGDNTSGAGAAIQLSYMNLKIPVNDSSSGFSLLQNYPNPFQTETTISYILFDDFYMQLDIVDVSGRVVKILVNRSQSAGFYRVPFDANELSSGLYFYRLRAGGKTEVKQLTIIR